MLLQFVDGVKFESYMLTDVQLANLFLYARFALYCVYIQVIIYKTGQKCWKICCYLHTQSFLQCSLGFSNRWYLLLRRGFVFISSCRLYRDKFYNCYAHACVLFLPIWSLGIGEADRTCLAAKIATQPSYIFILVPVFWRTIFSTTYTTGNLYCWSLQLSLEHLLAMPYQPTIPRWTCRENVACTSNTHHRENHLSSDLIESRSCRKKGYYSVVFNSSFI